jgi:multiple sugar transport system ATP-binding protein
MAAVTLEQLTKVYPNGHVGLRALDLEVADGEFLVLVGPSGCGKSTALRMVAGLEDITKGTLRIGDTVVNDLPPKDRDIAMVFQNYALYPHMTVGQNIGFALKLQGRPKAEINERVRRAARTLQLEEWLDRKPGQLSGGQRQRVAMGRAIVRDPAAFLMDEPLSNLDAKLRVQVRAEIARLQRELKTTTIYVTHDQVEAMTMGDRVAVLRDGSLQQVAEPEVLYDEPANLFVAAFIGSPAMNLLQGELAVTGDGATVRMGDETLPLSTAFLDRRPAVRAFDGRAVVVGIRPEILHDATLDRAPDGPRIRAEVELREALGAELLIHACVEARNAVTDEQRSLAEGEQTVVEHLEQQAREGRGAVVARLEPTSRARVGDVLDLVVDIDRLHLFDPETGLAIRF